MNDIKIHPSADVSDKALIGEGCKIWHQAQIREGARLGRDCIISKGVYIDKDVILGDKVKVQNYSSLYYRCKVEEGVFIGPYVCLTNDKLPRATTKEGELKTESDWQVGETLIKKGASVGAGSIILPGIEIGEYALVGAGSLVTKNVKPHQLVFGSPARVEGYVCKCGTILTRGKEEPEEMLCDSCKKHD